MVLYLPFVKPSIIRMYNTLLSLFHLSIIGIISVFQINKLSFSF